MRVTIGIGLYLLCFAAFALGRAVHTDHSTTVVVIAMGVVTSLVAGVIDLCYRGAR